MFNLMFKHFLITYNGFKSDPQLLIKCYKDFLTVCRI